MKVAPSHTPPSPPFPVPFWVGTVLRPPPPQGRSGGWGPQRAREGGRGGHPGLGVLTSARLRAEQAQDWFIADHSPAQLVAYTQRGLGHFYTTTGKKEETKAHSGL